MTQTDVAILEWLHDLEENGIVDAVSPTQVHRNMDDPPTYTHLNRRLRALEDAGLVEKPTDTSGLYRLGELGDRYLNDPDAEVEEFLPDPTADGEDDEVDNE